MSILIVILLIVAVGIFLVLTYQSKSTSEKLFDGVDAFFLRIFGIKEGDSRYERALDYAQFYMRKVAHVGSFFIMTWLLLRLIPEVWAITTMAVAAIGSELVKLKTGKGRHPQISDMAYNLLGMLAAWLIS